jgi:hypothetical protein
MCDSNNLYRDQYGPGSPYPERVPYAVLAERQAYEVERVAREAYAAALYTVPTTAVERAAGYEDWDTPGNVSPQDRQEAVEFAFCVLEGRRPQSPRRAPHGVVEALHAAVLDGLDSTGDWNFPQVEQEPRHRVARVTFTRGAVPPFAGDQETHFLVQAEPRTACKAGDFGDVISNEPSEVTCLGCLSLLAEARDPVPAVGQHA